MELEKYRHGDVLFDGHYRLIKLLSEDGGSADVWLAENYESVETAFSEEVDNVIKLDGTGVLVAIKIYRPKNALDVEGEQSFRQEFKTIYNCHHANLIPTTDYSIFDGMPYLVMPFCEKGSAENLAGKLTSPDDIWKFIYDTASGLEYLHACSPQIIHQDIKPANILIDANGNYCITDFGISVKSGIRDNQYLDNGNCGTTIYMPPERFEDNYSADVTSDIWSLGATIFELINGDVPYGDEGGIAQKKTDAMPVIKHGIPMEIQKLVYSCLSADPAKRPTAHQIVEIARNKGKKPMMRILWIPVLLISVLSLLLFWRLSQPSVKLVDSFSFYCHSADSVLTIQKQEARTDSHINCELAYDRLREAYDLLGIALTYESRDIVTRDSAIMKRDRVEALLPLLEEYIGIVDTLNQVVEDDLPIQVAKYTDKRNKASEEIKIIIAEI